VKTKGLKRKGNAPIRICTGDTRHQEYLRRGGKTRVSQKGHIGYQGGGKWGGGGGGTPKKKGIKKEIGGWRTQMANLFFGIRKEKLRTRGKGSVRKQGRLEKDGKGFAQVRQEFDWSEGAQAKGNKVSAFLERGNHPKKGIEKA